jgi:hypothetical protein
MLDVNAAVLVEELLLHWSAEPSIVHVLLASSLSSTRGAEQEAAFTVPQVNRPAFVALSSFLPAFRSVETMAGPAVTRKNCSSEDSAEPHQYQYVYSFVGYWVFDCKRVGQILGARALTLSANQRQTISFRQKHGL